VHGVVRLTVPEDHFQILSTYYRDRLEGVIPPKLPLLQEVLRDEGYRTAAFINHLALTVKVWPGLERGFQDYNDAYAFTTTLKDHCLGDERVTGDVLKWLKDTRKAGFFIWIHYVATHGPYTPPVPYLDLFKNDGLYVTGKRVPVNPSPTYDFGFIPRDHAQLIRGLGDVDTYISQYDGAIKFANDQVGRLYNGLREMELLENTIIIISADHGESLGDNQWYFAHSLAFESVIRVPLIIRGPGVPSACRTDALVSHIDIAPTIVDLLSVPAPRSFEGQSFVPLMRKETDKVRDLAFGESKSQQYVRTANYKLVVSNLPKRLEKQLGMNGEMVQLFDITADPHDDHNLANEKPDVTSFLRSRLNLYNSIEDAKAKLFFVEKVQESSLDDTTRDALESARYMKRSSGTPTPRNQGYDTGPK
jgi:arylsulfatase A-like enzyme